MTTDINDLVKRLRDERVLSPYSTNPVHVPICYEAADALTALQARVAELEAALTRREDMHECAMQERDDATLYADEQKARAEAAEAALERDRSFVADTINGVHSAIRSREWLLEGRGCYEWDDDRYRDEFAQALEAIRGPIDKLRAIAADWSNCPTDPAKIQAARALLPPSPAALAVPEVAALVEAVKPFYAAVFNDNGDITIDTGHLTRADWIKLDAAFGKVK